MNGSGSCVVGMKVVRRVEVADADFEVEGELEVAKVVVFKNSGLADESSSSVDVVLVLAESDSIRTPLSMDDRTAVAIGAVTINRDSETITVVVEDHCAEIKVPIPKSELSAAIVVDSMAVFASSEGIVRDEVVWPRIFGEGYGVGCKLKVGFIDVPATTAKGINGITVTMSDFVCIGRWTS